MILELERVTNNDYTLITGACGGLGRAFVTECAKNNENLFLIGTSEEKLSKLMTEFSSKFSGILVKTFVCNLAKTDDRTKLIEKLQEEGININKLINNAGVIIEGDLEKYTDEEIENVIQVNCIGTLDLTKKLLRIRNTAKKFEVLTVSSISSSFPIPHMAVYSATKSFLVSMMTALGFEYKDKNVVFTTVCPGGMATTKEMKESIESMGLGGKLSCLPTDKVAKKALRALKRKKKIVVPGFFNKLLIFISKPFSKTLKAKCAGKIWKKSQIKRKI